MSDVYYKYFCNLLNPRSFYQLFIQNSLFHFATNHSTWLYPLVSAFPKLHYSKIPPLPYSISYSHPPLTTCPPLEDQPFSINNLLHLYCLFFTFLVLIIYHLFNISFVCKNKPIIENFSQSKKHHNCLASPPAI